MKRILAVLATLTASAALAIGPNGQQVSIAAANANGNAGSCTAGTCAQVSLQVPSAGSTIFSGADAKYNSVSVQVLGTWSGTISFQYSQDEGATWAAIPAVPVNVGAVNLTPLPATSTAANGNWIISAAGLTSVRAVMSSYVSGTATVTMEQFVSQAYPSISAVPFVMDPAQRIVSGNSQRVSYSAQQLETVPTSAQALQAVEADGTNRLYLRHLKACIAPTALQTTAGLRTLVLYKTTAASAGGSTFTPLQWDSADAAFAGVARTGALTTTPAIGSVTVANSLASGVVALGAAVAGATATNACWEQYFGDAQGQVKPPVVPKGVANGLAIGDLTGGAGGAGSYNLVMDFSVEPL